jgi:hypothetical protein
MQAYVVREYLLYYYMMTKVDTFMQAYSGFLHPVGSHNPARWDTSPWLAYVLPKMQVYYSTMDE